ncbi:hypothetical protein DFH09DRAFT_1314253 [Mycena vulgaris]|nr:hypothetical protein DFH09DRAFT_1314253 [Mycena vulgaris]
MRLFVSVPTAAAAAEAVPADDRYEVVGSWSPTRVHAFESPRSVVLYGINGHDGRWAVAEKDNLAAICHSRGQIITLHSFELKFSPDVAVLPKPVIRLDPRDPVLHSSFTILSLGRFLVADRTGISIYKIPEEAFAQPNGHTWWALRT